MMDSYYQALANWKRDREQDLEYAAKNKEEPGIWSRLGQYPEDFALGMEANKRDASYSLPLSNPTLERLDQKYQQALKKAMQSGRVPSGWSGI
jgi:hypothetical protein